MNAEQRARFAEVKKMIDVELAGIHIDTGRIAGRIGVIEAGMAFINEIVAEDVLQNGDGIPSGVTIYGQRDPRWANDKLGNSATTIGGYGCLMTCAASMLTDAGVVMTPEQLNVWLKVNGGYTNGNRFVFASIDKLNTVKFSNIIECANIPAPIDKLDAAVKAGDFVIVKVDFDPATMAVEEHWVRYLADGKCMDPWRGDIAPIVPRYRGANAAQAILRAVIYKRTATA